ncbi:lipopolysaccharide heptosyltransferase family protein [Helicobacter muridarum]|uniref:ADP-heptose:LPS heptosyltransferase n=1 Tax=Helicobacter muridarum TaxID=216 RepID=A0A377PSJ7_9HELI|nr:glycosyltransferase family 9 protein [Helicobacter muridarum]TLE01341.1 lipopolysaccharide heptosyltransferase family protein [Helicobacter muridarum]STQ85261.1 ADP-heptose:LPS heptosyltransferase [Helicobacter muridarum]
MNILIRLPNWLGDTVMFMPTIRLINKVYPNMKCILVGNDISTGLFCENEYIMKIFIDDSKKAINVIKRIDSINALATSINTYLEQSNLKLDCALTAQNNLFSAMLLSKIKVGMKIGYGDRNVFGVRKFILTHLIKFKSGRPPACNHQVLNYANLILPILPASFFEEINLDKINYIANPNASNLQNKLFSQIGKLYIPNQEIKEQRKMSDVPIIAISPGASYGKSKMWLPEYFSEISMTLINKGYIVRIYGTKSEEEYNKHIENRILNILHKKHHNRLQNLTGKTTIQNLIYSLKQCSLYIGNDSGTMHIVKALEIPSIIFFGPMPLSWCAPWNPKYYQEQFMPNTKNKYTNCNKNITNNLSTSKKHQVLKLEIESNTETISIDSSIVLKKNLPCMPCKKRVCPLSHHNCMKLITPDEVLILAESLLLQ